jgi:predicted nucleic acid-binding protein
VIYLDTSALMKLVIAEPESPALAEYLGAHTDTGWFTCALTRPEFLRDAAAVHPDAETHAQQVLAGLDTVAVTDRLLDVVARLDPPPARLVDAVHIAAALTAGNRLAVMVTYNQQLAGAAHDHRITAVNPVGAPCFAP